MIGRWLARRRANAAVLRGAEHDRRRLVSAADWTITTARRAARPDELARVMVADVQRRAADDFGLDVAHDLAAAVLRDRLRLRLSYDIDTDAFGTSSR